MIPDRWLRVAVPASDELSRDLVADVLIGLGGRAVIEEDGLLTTYVTAPADLDRFVDGVRTALTRVAGAGQPHFGWQPHEDWEFAWREGLAPRRIGRHILVTPTWIDPPTQPEDILIRIDPGVAFGTAEHATTRLALALIERALEPGDRVLDVGTGSGILAVAAARLGAGRVRALDNDSMACEQARANLEGNAVASLVDVEWTMVRPEDRLGRFDGVVANIVMGLLIPLLPALQRSLVPGGWLVISGAEQSESEEARRAAEALGFAWVDDRVEEGWWAGWFRRPTANRPLEEDSRDMPVPPVPVGPRRTP
jgi:ribosomal protein L11 methyltransferase